MRLAPGYPPLTLVAADQRPRRPADKREAVLNTVYTADPGRPESTVLPEVAWINEPVDLPEQDQPRAGCRRKITPPHVSVDLTPTARLLMPGW